MLHTPYGTANASGYLGMRPGTLRELIRRGEGPKHYQCGKRLRFLQRHLDESMRHKSRRRWLIVARPFQPCGNLAR